MARLLGWGAFLALLLVVGVFVPFGGKTVVERWRAARGPGAFVERNWREVGARWDRLWGDASEAGRAGSRTARASPPRPAAKPATTRGARPAPAPEEHHTEADRNALDRIVAEHVR